MEEQDPDALLYVLYLAAIRIDNEREDIPPLYAYGQTEEQARINLQLWFLPDDWDRVEIVSVTPHPEGYQYADGIDLPGMITQVFYRAYLPTIKPLGPTQAPSSFVKQINRSLEIAGNRERLKRRVKIRHRGLELNWMDIAVALSAEKPIEQVIEAQLLLRFDDEEAIYEPTVAYTDPLDGFPPAERRKLLKELGPNTQTMEWEEFSRLLGLAIADLLIQTGRHGRIKVVLTNDGPPLEKQE